MVVSIVIPGKTLKRYDSIGRFLVAEKIYSADDLLVLMRDLLPMYQALKEDDSTSKSMRDFYCGLDEARLLILREGISYVYINFH